jgi:hypothetical protein
MVDVVITLLLLKFLSQCQAGCSSLFPDRLPEHGDMGAGGPDVAEATSILS